MRHATLIKNGKRNVRLVGVVAAARALDVNHRTLQRVIRGEWKSKTLLARYEALKKIDAAIAAPSEKEAQCL